MITTIIFDIYGVMLRSATQRMAECISEKYKVPIKQVLMTIRGQSMKLLNVDRITLEEFYRRCAKEMNIDAMPEELEQCWPKENEHIPGMIELVDSLRKKYKVVALTNIAKPSPRRLPALDEVKKHFELFIASHDTRIAKPAPEAFSNAAQMIGVNLDECVFIDDKEENVKAADAVGMTGILCTSPKQVKDELKGLGISL